MTPEKKKKTHQIQDNYSNLRHLPVEMQLGNPSSN